MSKKRRQNIKLNPDDSYFLNNLKNRLQWYESDNEFIGSISDDEWYMLSDYLFRLAKDYTAFANNKEMHEKKREEAVADIKKCARTALQMAGVFPRIGEW